MSTGAMTACCTAADPMTTNAALLADATADIKTAIGLLKLHGANKDASSLAMDLTRAGTDLREVLMVREDADRLACSATFDELDDAL